MVRIYEAECPGLGLRRLVVIADDGTTTEVELDDLNPDGEFDTYCVRPRGRVASWVQSHRRTRGWSPFRRMEV